MLRTDRKINAITVRMASVTSVDRVQSNLLIARLGEKLTIHENAIIIMPAVGEEWIKYPIVISLTSHCELAVELRVHFFVSLVAAYFINSLSHHCYS